MTTNPQEPATDAVNCTAQEILAALQAQDAAKVNSYYAPDAVIATPGRPGGVQGHQGRYCGSQLGYYCPTPASVK